MDLERKLWRRTKVQPGPLSTDCYVWIGWTQDGYGRMEISRTPVRVTRGVHTLAYEHFVGPVPPGQEPDHLCRVRPCWRPEHLEAVTHRVNCLRGVGVGAIAAARTACVNGHDFTVENTRLDSRGKRVCRACDRIWHALHRRSR